MQNYFFPRRRSQGKCDAIPTIFLQWFVLTRRRGPKSLVEISFFVSKLPNFKFGQFLYKWVKMSKFKMMPIKNG